MPTLTAKRNFLLLITAILLLAFWLRVHHIGVSALRGDEAFTVRYWAQPITLYSGLVTWEPHPLGIFVILNVWKSLVGDGEFAMRLLPALINLLGTAGMYAFTRRLLHSNAVALIAAILWAINPNLIWHSQDVRNYAMWSGISIVSLWLLLRVTDSRARRIDWILYILSTTLGLYIFFLEAFIVVVHGLYVVCFKRQALRKWLFAVLVMLVLTLPLAGQAWMLLHSGYGGSAVGAEPALLFTQFLPELLFGENLNTTAVQSLYALAVVSVLIHLVIVRVFYPGKPLYVLLLLLIVPTVLLLIIATRIDVFRARYLLAITPALIISAAVTINVVVRGLRFPKALSTQGKIIVPIGLLMTVLIGYLISDALVHYYTDYHKAADWRGLAAWMHVNVSDDDQVIVTSIDPTTGSIDPAFEYYIRHSFLVLPYPGAVVQDFADKALAEHGDVWLIPIGAYAQTVHEALTKQGMLLREQNVSGFMMRQFRSWTVDPREIQVPLSVDFGDVARLRGYTQFEGMQGDKLLLLYWEARNKTPTPYSILTHIVASSDFDSSPVAALDHGIATGQVATIAWAPGVLYRDPVVIPANVADSHYIIRVGLYESETLKLVPIDDTRLEKEYQGRYPLKQP